MSATQIPSRLSDQGLVCQTSSLVRRFEASVTSAIPVIAMTMVFAWVLGFMLDIGLLLERTYGLHHRQSEALTCVIIYGIPILWFVFDGSFFKATYGMRVRSIRFCVRGGKTISLGRCCCRILIGLLLLPLAPISLVIAIIDGENRSIADVVCGTVVCMKKA